MLEGSCHCGAITLALDTARAPAELVVRLCGCTFCARHRPRYTTDPAGHVTIRAASEAGLARYRFGLRLADFLICRTCGVFVAALEPGEAGEPGAGREVLPGAARAAGAVTGRAVVNAAVLARAAELIAEPTQFTGYDSEDAPTRTARRARAWTPATLVIGG